MPSVVTELNFYKFPASFLLFALTTMKALTSVLTATAFSLLVVAHGGDNLDARGRYARQASSSPNTNSHSGSTTSSSVPSTGPIPSNSVNPSVTANPSSTPSIAFTLLSTNPTAVPLASIVSNQSSLPIPTLTTTESPGPGPSGIPSAPLLPDSTLHALPFFLLLSQPHNFFR